MNLSIISSTDRPNSWSLKLSNYISRLYAERNVKAKVVSLEDFPLADVVGGKYGKEITSIKKFREPILEADGIIFVIPEYNGGFPGILKMFIDYLPFPGAFEKNAYGFCRRGIWSFWSIETCGAISNDC